MVGPVSVPHQVPDSQEYIELAARGRRRPVSLSMGGTAKRSTLAEVLPSSIPEPWQECEQKEDDARMAAMKLKYKAAVQQISNEKHRDVLIRRHRGEQFLSIGDSYGHCRQWAQQVFVATEQKLIELLRA